MLIILVSNIKFVLACTVFMHLGRNLTVPKGEVRFMGRTLRQRYCDAAAQYDIFEQAACFMEAFSSDNPDLQAFFAEKSDVLLAAILLALQEQDGEQALRYFSFFSEEIYEAHPFLLFWRGKAFYILPDMARAEECFRSYQKICPEDELVYFYWGNICAQTGRTEQAFGFYAEALKRYGDFPEVMVNSALLLASLGDEAALRDLVKNPKYTRYFPADGALCSEADALGQTAFSEQDVKALPIFINSRDRLGCLQQLVDWLLAAGYTNLSVLDNASSYGPLLSYYSVLEQMGVKVYYLRENMGYRALWKSNLLELLRIDTPYVYTDSDVVPGRECPDDLLRYLLRVLQRYPYLKKAGCALAYEDITFFDAEDIRRKEAHFYDIALEKDVYFAAVDTTFALYRNRRHYSLYESARLGGRLTIRHLPWYYDYEHLPEDERYYLEHAEHSSTLAWRMKKI